MALGFGSFFSPLQSPQRWLGCARTTLKGVVSSLSVLGILTTMVVQPVLAHSPAQEQQPSPEDSTQQLLSLHGRYQHAAPAQRAQALDQLFAGAVERSQHLASLMKTDPAAVLRVAIPDAIRSSLPSEIQPYIEKTVQIEGTLEVILEHTHPGSILRYFLDTGKKRFSLHFAADPPFNLQSGAPVAGASVTFTITKANGSIVTSTATTGTNGGATFSYKLRKQDPIGSYKAQGNAPFNGIAGSASTNFMVQ